MNDNDKNSGDGADDDGARTLSCEQPTTPTTSAPQTNTLRLVHTVLNNLVCIIPPLAYLNDGRLRIERGGTFNVRPADAERDETRRKITQQRHPEHRTQRPWE